MATASETVLETMKRELTNQGDNWTIVESNAAPQKDIHSCGYFVLCELGKRLGQEEFTLYTASNARSLVAQAYNTYLEQSRTSSAIQ